jgi:hypothetical protein
MVLGFVFRVWGMSLFVKTLDLLHMFTVVRG